MVQTARTRPASCVPAQREMELARGDVDEWRNSTSGRELAVASHQRFTPGGQSRGGTRRTVVRPPGLRPGTWGRDLWTGPWGRDPGDGTLVAPLQIRILHSRQNGLSPAERWSCERPSLVLSQVPDDNRMTAFAPPPLFCRESALIRLRIVKMAKNSAEFSSHLETLTQLLYKMSPLRPVPIGSSVPPSHPFLPGEPSTLQSERSWVASSLPFPLAEWALDSRPASFPFSQLFAGFEDSLRPVA